MGKLDQVVLSMAGALWAVLAMASDRRIHDGSGILRLTAIQKRLSATVRNHPPPGRAPGSKQRESDNEDAAGFRIGLLFNSGVRSKPHAQKTQANSSGSAENADGLQTRGNG
jgi:hypothetical protein